MRYLSLGLMVMLIAFTAGVAQATMIFQDGFETHTAMGTGDPDLDYDPGTPPTGDSWYIRESHANQAQLYKYASPGAASGNNYIKTRREISSKYGQAHARLSDANVTLLETEGTLVVQTEINVASASANSAVITGWHGEPSGSVSWHEGRTFDLYFEADGDVMYYDGDYKDTGLDYTIGTWQSVKIVADFDTDTYTVEVEGNPAAGSFAFHTSQSHIRSVLFGCSNDGTTAYYDDVQLDVIPEPMTMSLLGIGAVMMLVRRKRK